MGPELATDKIGHMTRIWEDKEEDKTLRDGEEYMNIIFLQNCL